MTKRAFSVDRRRNAAYWAETPFISNIFGKAATFGNWYCS